MQATRRARLESVILKELSTVVPRSIKDPRVPPVTFTRAEVTEDGSQATVFVTLLGGGMTDRDGNEIPEEVLAQVQAESIRADIQKKAADLELQRQKMIMDDDFRRDQMSQDRLLKQMELELKYNTQLNTAQIVAEQNVNREVIREQGALAQQAMAQAQQAPMQPINPTGMV